MTRRVKKRVKRPRSALSAPTSDGLIGVQDVAVLAGVSVATVSRVMNAPEKVSSEFLERVRVAAHQLGYMPNSAARALRSRRTRIIGTVIPTLRHAIYARQVEAMQRRLKKDGYLVLVTTSDYDLAIELEQIKLLIERGIDGLVLVGGRHDPKLFDMLQARGVEHVSTYWYSERSSHACIGFNNRRVTAKAADYLADLGHREFAMVAGITKDNDRANERIEGVREALALRGIDFGPERVVEKPYMIGAGREAFRTFQARGIQPTAIICGSDVLAFGVLAECAAVGLKVPADISVTGFDNLEFATHLQPSLTTIEVPADAMGELAADYLVRRLAGQSVEMATELEANLISRGTTGPPPDRDR